MTGTLARPTISPGRDEGQNVMEEEELTEEPVNGGYADANEDVFGSTANQMPRRNGTAERRADAEDRRYAARR